MIKIQNINNFKKECGSTDIYSNICQIFSQYQTYPQSATSLNLKYQTRPQPVNYP